MEVKNLAIEFRTPTVQYGYINTKYDIAIDEEAGDTIESVIRYVAIENDRAITRALEAMEASKKAYSWDTIPFN